MTCLPIGYFVSKQLVPLAIYQSFVFGEIRVTDSVSFSERPEMFIVLYLF